MKTAPRKMMNRLGTYSAIGGVGCFVGYLVTGFAYPLLLLLGPSFFLIYWLRAHGGTILNLIPNEPLPNHLFLLLPITVIYFSLVGFQLRNIINERGKIRLLFLLVFSGFLVYIHYAAFQELTLYWEGSQPVGRP